MLPLGGVSLKFHLPKQGTETGPQPPLNFSDLCCFLLQWDLSIPPYL